MGSSYDSRSPTAYPVAAMNKNDAATEGQLRAALVLSLRNPPSPGGPALYRGGLA